MTTTKTFKYGGLTLDKINSVDASVPNTALDIDLPLSDRKALAIAINHNLPALLIGETGTGKTSVIKQLAFLRQQPYARVNLNGFTTPDELIGTKSVKDGATYFENGVITNAMQNGSILVLDEINATTPDCLFILHGLLDEDRRVTLPNGDIITPHEDFRVFATCNPDYEGTKSMNKAFMDRFPIILAIDIMPYKKEMKLLTERTGIDEELALSLVSIATMARKDYIDNKISTFVSTRGLINIGKLVSQGLTAKEAYITTIIRKTNNKEEQQILRDFFNLVMKTNESSSTNPDRPILTTQNELDLLNETISRLRENSNEYIELKRLAQNEAIEAKAKAQELTEANERLLRDRQELQAKTDEQAQELITYKKLDEMIKGIANKQV